MAATYTNWLPREPSNQDGDEDCVHKYVNDIVRGWNDFSCDEEWNPYGEVGIHALCMMKYKQIHVDKIKVDFINSINLSSQ